ncbi:hypothetical protein ABIA32_002707 [Streptacidiphilus sp. MAP12-20]|uniref:hypothetical protein n=1 Tax=Streptacidiphilus sp. MAP12-20 TaxID=3156299 RepID=UPI003513D602
MLIGVLIGFVTVGLGLASFQACKRRWLEAARYAVSTAIGVAGYASMLLHKSWIGFAALPVALIAAVGYVVVARSQARKLGASAERP